MDGKVLGDASGEFGIGCGDAGIEKDEHLRRAIEVAGLGDEVAQGQILGIKGTVGERDTMMEGDGDGTMSHRGGKNDKARTHPRQLDAYAQKTESCRPVRVWFDPRVFF
jgi:hypothetical protein